MRNITLLTYTSIAVISLILLAGFRAPVPLQKPQATYTKAIQETNLEGAWHLSGTAAKNNTEDITTLKIVQDGFFTVAVYDQRNKKFIGTYGGTYISAGGKLTETYEFNTFDSTQVGTLATGKFSVKGNKWQTTGLGRSGKGSETWEKMEEQNSSSPLAGTWRISARERDGQMSIMRPGPRKTLKVLSGTRFQWIAFNSETGEFSGTGGGTYTAQDGKYTEHIEFFSRDSSRVGMQLSFNFEVKDGKWHHTGQSSTGSKVNEIWERISAR